MLKETNSIQQINYYRKTSMEWKNPTGQGKANTYKVFTFYNYKTTYTYLSVHETTYQFTN